MLVSLVLPFAVWIDPMPQKREFNGIDDLDNLVTHDAAWIMREIARLDVSSEIRKNPGYLGNLYRIQLRKMLSNIGLAHLADEYIEAMIDRMNERAGYMERLRALGFVRKKAIRQDVQILIYNIEEIEEWLEKLIDKRVRTSRKRKLLRGQKRKPAYVPEIEG